MNKQNPSNNPRNTESSSGLGSEEGFKKVRCPVCLMKPRKCPLDCEFERYFPLNNSERFLNAYLVFGLDYILSILGRNYNTDLEKHAAIDAMVSDATSRLIDPPGRCYRIIQNLETENATLRAQLQAAQMMIHHTMQNTIVAPPPQVHALQAQQKPHIPSSINGGAENIHGYGESSLGLDGSKKRILGDQYPPSGGNHSQKPNYSDSQDPFQTTGLGLEAAGCDLDFDSELDVFSTKHVPQMTPSNSHLLPDSKSQATTPQNLVEDQLQGMSSYPQQRGDATVGGLGKNPGIGANDPPGKNCNPMPSIGDYQMEDLSPPRSPVLKKHTAQKKPPRNKNRSKVTISQVKRRNS